MQGAVKKILQIMSWKAFEWPTTIKKNIRRNKSIDKWF